jgi:glycosyltransferase involved in cell wall biosynthesis
MRILWLKTELLHPVDKGGKIRTYQMLKELRRDHHITYLTLDDGTAASDAKVRATEYCHEVACVPHHTQKKFSAGFYVELGTNLVSHLPYYVKKYESSQMRHEIVSRLKDGKFDIVVCDFLNPAVNLPDELQTPSLIFQHNVESMIWRRHYEVQSNPVKKAYLYGQWKKSVSFERTTCRRFDFVAAVSREDATTFEREFGVSSVDDVPTGVDTEFFKPSSRVAAEPFNLVFTGSMDWLPNDDAIQFFSNEVLPLIRKEVPEVTVTVVGRNPLPALVDLGKRDPAFRVAGRVDDVRPYMEQAAVYIVPIRVGGGTRLKIFEAMAMEKPIVSTTIGAEGLPLTAGQELLIADTAEAFANAVIRLIRNPKEARMLGANAAELVRREFGWRGVADKFGQLCEEAVTRFQARHASSTGGAERLLEQV